MAKKQMTIQHHLDQPNAIAQTKVLIERLRTKHAGEMTVTQESWTDNTCALTIDASGYTITGTITVQSGAVTIECDMPLLVRAFWGRIESMIREEARPLFS
ncbi:MAG: polyhydroxyalkanoic acid system family protein [Patescibacteria group bacterium]